MSDAMGDETVSSNGEPDTKEAEALAAALNHSAERVQTLWFSFLTFMLYLAIATWTTTHRMLFLGSPLKLPVLNIDLPLLGFYILTPVIFVVFHFYMLLNLVLLARTADGFNKALARAFPKDDASSEDFRMRIENTLFVQLLVGARREREGINAKLLSLMALITLALAPAALLLLIQIKFLPYHSELMTWWHRFLLFVDLALVWTLWPGYRSGWGVLSWPKRSWRLVPAGAVSAVALFFAALVVTFPGEKHMFLSSEWPPVIIGFNALNLGGEDLISDAKLARIEKNESSTYSMRWTLDLAGRDLTGAELSFADIRHVNFTSAILRDANLSYVWAKQARFSFADLHGATLEGAQLQGAQFNGDVFLPDSLYGVQLQGANLDGVFFSASLNHVYLQGASLYGAYLQGRSLKDVYLQGASLHGASLQGASLDGVQLQGASLDGAYLQGASLDNANLRGALLDHAELQGASLDHAQLQGASFVDACVWRADARRAAWEDTRVARLTTTGPKADKVPECAWTGATFGDAAEKDQATP
ncbi:MAG: pentapeptide repeat-containing protein [Methylocella sp.]